MSIQKRQRKKGPVYVVHYWDTEQKKYRNKTFPRRADAVAYEAMIALAKRRGDLAELDAGTQTVQEFIEKEWWPRYAQMHLAPKTQAYYRIVQKHILGAFGPRQLRLVKPADVAEWAELLTSRGMPPETLRKTMALFQGIMERAVSWGQIRVNPVKAVKKPAIQRQRAPRPSGLDGVEHLTGRLRGRDRALVGILAYAGLRPGEALALRWDDITDVSINVDKALSLGAERSTKNRRSRLVRLAPALRALLRDWQLLSGCRDGLVFPMRGGGPWTESAYRNWRRRVFQPAATALGISTRPYDLRHSFASRLFAEGHNPAYIAEQMGHTLQTLLSTYVHIMEADGDLDRASGAGGAGDLGDLRARRPREESPQVEHG